MERDFEKFGEYLAKNAREGVIIENMILEWKLAEQAKRVVTAEQGLTAASNETNATKSRVASA